MIRSKMNNLGFSLVEVMMVSGLMLIISLGAAQFITSQGQQISVMEDRMSRLQLEQEFNRIFGDRDLCAGLLKNVRIYKNQDPQEIRVINALNNVIYDPNLEENLYDHLNIDFVHLRNLTVKGANDVGELEVIVGLERLRKGGSNNQMSPISLRFPAVINKKSFVTSCYPRRAPICGDTIILQAGKLPDPRKDFRNCCPGGGALSDCITTGLEKTPGGNSIFYICTCE